MNKSQRLSLTFIYCSLISFFAFSENTFREYKIEYDFYYHCRDTFSENPPLKESVFYALFEDSEFHRKNSYEKFDMKIINKKGKFLVYDFSDLLNKTIGPISFSINRYVYMAFYEIPRGVDIILNIDNYAFYLIRYDFDDNRTQLINSIKINPVYGEYFINENVCHNYLLSNKLTVNNIPDQKEFYSGIKNNYQYCYRNLSEYCDFYYRINGNELILDNTKLIGDSGKKGIVPKTLEEEEIAPDWPGFYYFMIDDLNIITDGCLIENDVVYSKEHLRQFSDTPWVSKDSKIGEEIVITSNQEITMLFIGNGFFRDKKRNLFFENNRVKELTIKYENDIGLEHKVILQDNALVQMIPLLDASSKKITIRIDSIYLGTKYNDTCINFIGATNYNLKKMWQNFENENR